MANKEQEENPLADLYVDASEEDRERIRDAISGLVGIDTETAKPVLREKFSSLTSKKQFTALLLYRRALLSLDELEEDETVGQDSTYFADLIGVDDSTIRHAATDLDFVVNDDEQGGYLVPPHKTHQATKWVNSGEED
jgi:hypothetical protein